MAKGTKATNTEPGQGRQRGRLLRKLAAAAWKLLKGAARLLWRLVGAAWKALRGGVRSGQAGQGPPRPAHILVQRIAIFLSLAVGVVIAVEIYSRRDVPCRLPDQVSDPVIQQGWPQVREWCPLIMRASARYDLDPLLIAAIIRVESAGDPHAYSQSGAVGLMQVMPRDGLAASFQCPLGPCFADRPTIRQLQDPAFNVDYGAGLLADNLALYGSLREALRAYGPHDVGYGYADYVLVVYEDIRP